MDAKTAYCYLNCTQAANCCATCGQCPACCIDCPTDYSNFSDTAYYKDGVFYKNYTTTYTSSLQSNYSDSSCVTISSTSYTTIYNSKTNTCLASGSNNSNTCCDDGDQTHTSGFCRGNECFSSGCNNNDDCWINSPTYDCNSKCGTDCSGTSPAACTLCVDDQCPEFNFGCSGLECICDPNECEGSYETVYSATTSFEDPVNLYNSKGEVVNPGFIGASYDPCNPCRTWGASCYFFAP
jgi:hypothetical protein